MGMGWEYYVGRKHERKEIREEVVRIFDEAEQNRTTEINDEIVEGLRGYFNIKPREIQPQREQPIFSMKVNNEV